MGFNAKSCSNDLDDLEIPLKMAFGVTTVAGFCCRIHDSW